MNKATGQFRRLLSGKIARLAGRHTGRLSIFAMRKLTGTQLRPRQILAIVAAIRQRQPCNFLVFGLGNDSPFWHHANTPGRTVFLEDHPDWYREVSERHPFLEAYQIAYTTKQKDWRKIEPSSKELWLNLPPSVMEQKWDVILVDAPAGWHEEGPGRMQSIHMSSVLCAAGGTVFVHDCDRAAENFWSDTVFSGAAEREEIPGARGKRLLRRYRLVGG